MPEIARFSVSLESDLLERFDRFCAESRFATRSEAIRQLLREKLTVEAVSNEAAEVAARAGGRLRSLSGRPGRA